MLIDTHLHLDEPWLKSNEQHRKTIEDINTNKIMAWGQSTDIDSYERVKKVAEQSCIFFLLLVFFFGMLMNMLTDLMK